MPLYSKVYLCDNYLTEQVSKGFIYDSGACLPDKGTEFARKRFYVALKRHYREHGLKGCVLKCDLADYFGSTSHTLASKSIEERVQDGWAVSETNRIINSFNQGANPDVGLYSSLLKHAITSFSVIFNASAIFGIYT